MSVCARLVELHLDVFGMAGSVEKWITEVWGHSGGIFFRSNINNVFLHSTVILQTPEHYSVYISISYIRTLKLRLSL